MSAQKLLIISVWLFGSLVGATFSEAQSPGMENLQSVAEKIMQNRGRIQQALKAYSWNQRTEVVKDGEVMTTRMDLVRYDSSGAEQRTTLDQKLPKQKKRIAGRLQKKKMAEMKDWGDSVKSLLMLYSLPDVASLNNFLGKAKIVPTGGPGQIMLTSNNVYQSGDRMTLYINEKDKRILNTEVFTNHEGDSVHMEITYGQLPEDINYIREMIVDIDTREMRLKVENFNYNRN